MINPIDAYAFLLEEKSSPSVLSVGLCYTHTSLRGIMTCLLA